MLGSLLVAIALFTRQVNEHGETCRALNDRADGGAFKPNEQVPFPMSGHRTIFNFGGSLADQGLGRDVGPRHSPGTFAWCS